jgi:hypothetical protein
VTGDSVKAASIDTAGTVAVLVEIFEF